VEKENVLIFIKEGNVKTFGKDIGKAISATKRVGD